ncbi:hypothetical protein BHE74_00012185 [Ensete ventricosum]|nr:hypothetical protein GW17_00005709 [Ensete ventricosum]RWW79524.1 hypothetical protein BHE74_00012185 [Ensete ventricosum]RZR94806.1 hypothetical protein BHM03_00023567 [Ensete ventricosum]
MGKALLLLLVCVSYQLSCASAFNRFSVGDEKGWIPGVNYTIWEKKHRPFHVGDWLVFYYQPRTSDVVQVDEDAYDKCDASSPISNYSKGRSYAFELNHTGRYYFICSFGYCYQGMKLSILVEPLTSPSAPLSAKKKSSASAAPPPLALTSSAALAATLLAAAALLRVL